MLTIETAHTIYVIGDVDKPIEIVNQKHFDTAVTLLGLNSDTHAAKKALKSIAGIDISVASDAVDAAKNYLNSPSSTRKVKVGDKFDFDLSELKDGDILTLKGEHYEFTGEKRTENNGITWGVFRFCEATTEVVINSEDGHKAWALEGAIYSFVANA